jgi:hypothetical protein
MKVYHGTNVKINNPNIRTGRIDTDFGQGFYVTFGQGFYRVCHELTYIC